MSCYNEAEIQFIKDNLNVLTCNEIGKAIGRSKSSISNKISELGLVKPYLRHQNTEKNYSNDEIQFIKDTCNQKTWGQIAECLGRTKASIIDKAKKLGIIKDPSIQYKHRKNVWQDPSIALAKQNMALKSKLTMADIPDNLAELHALRIKFNYQITKQQCK